jgi:hypothetical protein
LVCRLSIIRQERERQHKKHKYATSSCQICGSQNTLKHSLSPRYHRLDLRLCRFESPVQQRVRIGIHVPMEGEFATILRKQPSTRNSRNCQETTYGTSRTLFCLPRSYDLHDNGSAFGQVLCIWNYRVKSDYVWDYMKTSGKAAQSQDIIAALFCSMLLYAPLRYAACLIFGGWRPSTPPSTAKWPGGAFRKHSQQKFLHAVLHANGL